MTEMYKHKSGNVIPMRRTSKPCATDDYTPCEYCLALFRQRDLWKHVKFCKHKPPGPKQKRRQYRYNRCLLGCGASIASSGMKDVLQRMNPGKIATAIRNDTLS